LRLPTKKRMVAAAAIAVVAVSLALALRYLENFQPYFGQYHDDAVYVATAQAFARGEGYKQPFLPGEVFQTKYPPLYPVVLSTIWRVDNRFPMNILWMEALGVALGTAFAVLSCTYLYKTRRVTELLELVLLSATLLNSRFLAFLPIPMSDLLYGVLSVIALWLTERAFRAGKSSLAIGAGIATGAASLTRAAGIALIPANLACLLSSRNKRSAVLYCLLSLALFLPFAVWAKLHQDLGTDSMIWYTSYSGWMTEAYRALGTQAVTAKAADAFRGLMVMVWPLLSDLSYGRLAEWQFFLIYRIAFAFLWLVLIAGLISELRKPGRRALPLYVIFYLCTALFWPGFFEWRIFMVVLPFLYYYFYLGFRTVGAVLQARFFPGHHGWYQKTARYLAITFGAYLIVGSAISAFHHAGRYPPLVPNRPDLTIQQQHADLLETFAWIQYNTPREAVFVCNNDPLLYLYTGRKAMQPSPYQGWRTFSGQLITPDSVLEVLKESGASYLMIDPSLQGAYLPYAQLVGSAMKLGKERPGLLEPLYTSSNGLVTVCRVDRSKLP
jgi:hypothetical protein